MSISELSLHTAGLLVSWLLVAGVMAVFVWLTALAVRRCR